MPKQPAKSVVITGASTGIGRSTALAFAREGCDLTLIARDGSELGRVVRDCRRLGGRAQYVVADVTSPADMREAASAAVRRYGRVDVWVNNAGIGAVGRFTEVPVEAHDQVLAVNLGGYVHGAHAVMPYFLASHSGVLINVVSFGAYVGTPFGASYTASKFGLRGLSESLRAELQDEPDIHICDVFPGFVDTAGVAHAGNYSGHRLNVRAPDRPEQVADAIVRLAWDPQDKVSVGAVAKLAPLAYALAPGLGRWVMNRVLGLSSANAEPQEANPGALYAPGSSGGKSAHVSLGMGFAGVTAAALVAGFAVAMAARRS